MVGGKPSDGFMDNGLIVRTNCWRIRGARSIERKRIRPISVSHRRNVWQESSRGQTRLEVVGEEREERKVTASRANSAIFLLESHSKATRGKTSSGPCSCLLFYFFSCALLICLLPKDFCTESTQRRATQRNKSITHSITGTTQASAGQAFWGRNRK